MKEILNYISESAKQEIGKNISNDTEEIRLRVGRPITLKKENQIQILQHVTSTEEILETFEKICENSVYSYKKQICEGFITIKGGHRVGITGNCIFEDGQVQNINYISSLNFRMAREKKECSNIMLRYVIKNDCNSIYNTMIVSTPGTGKTTILRDLIRKISNGIPEIGFIGKTCGVVDERGEIAAMYKGVPQNDVGILTDVISNISKAKGMNMLIRSMAPQIIACDEIGSKEDVQAINYAICSGAKGIFTAHGENIEELMLNTEMNILLNSNIIEKIIFLDTVHKGNIKEVYKLDKNSRKYCKEE